MLKQAADKSSVDIFISGTWKVHSFQKIIKLAKNLNSKLKRWKEMKIYSAVVMWWPACSDFKSWYTDWPRHEPRAEIIMNIDTDMKMEKIASNNKY